MTQSSPELHDYRLSHFRKFCSFRPFLKFSEKSSAKDLTSLHGTPLLEGFRALESARSLKVTKCDWKVFNDQSILCLCVLYINLGRHRRFTGGSDVIGSEIFMDPNDLKVFSFGEFDPGSE